MLAVSDSESGVLSEEELGSCIEMVDVGEEGSGGVVLWSSVLICEVPLRETRCMSNLFKHNCACDGGAEMGLN